MRKLVFILMVFILTASFFPVYDSFAKQPAPAADNGLESGNSHEGHLYLYEEGYTGKDGAWAMMKYTSEFPDRMYFKINAHGLEEGDYLLVYYPIDPLDTDDTAPRCLGKDTASKSGKVFIMSYVESSKLAMTELHDDYDLYKADIALVRLEPSYSGECNGEEISVEETEDKLLLGEDSITYIDMDRPGKHW